MLKQFVEFFYPGSFMSETSEVEISTRTLPAEVPQRAYGYRFFERQVAEVDGEKLVGQKKNFSGRVFLGEEVSLQDAIAREGENSILVRNMRCNNWSRVGKTRQGYIPLNDADRVVHAF